jgi:hypothetical protein
VEVTHVILR